MLSIVNLKTLHKKNFLLFNRVQVTHQKPSGLDNNESTDILRCTDSLGLWSPWAPPPAGELGRQAAPNCKGKVPGTLFSATVGTDEGGPRGSWRKVCTKNLECDG